MAYASTVACFGTLLLLLPIIVTSDIFPPFQLPNPGDVCKNVQCGKGTCKPSKDSILFYECDCDANWKQQIVSTNNVNPKFLPCIVPNCKLKNDCTGASSPLPVQNKPSNANQPIFNPCSWTDCGGGSCNQISNFTHSCACKEGYSNLLNNPAFPCYQKNCVIGTDCSGLGISLPLPSPPPPPASASDSTNQGETSPPPPPPPPPVMAVGGKNQATSILQEKLHWLVVLTMLLCVVQ